MGALTFNQGVAIGEDMLFKEADHQPLMLIFDRCAF